jgi:hypothetical protein
MSKLKLTEEQQKFLENDFNNFSEEQINSTFRQIHQIMFWDDVRFVFKIVVLGFAIPSSIILGIITTDYVVCNTITSCANAGGVKND